MIIRWLDPVDCEVVSATKEEVSWLRDLLTYRGEYYKRNRYGGETVQYEASLLRRRLFPSGFIPRILKHADRAPGKVEVEGIQPVKWPSTDRPFPLTLREEQLRLVMAALRNRGIIVSPTGSGKTVIAGAIFAKCTQLRCMLVTHSTDIVEQTKKEFREWGLDNVVVVTRQALCGTETILRGGVEVNRTIIREKHREDLLRLDVLMVDEVHKFGDEGGQYHTILRHTLAPMRIGLTATMPTDNKMQMLLEGMLGPVIGEVSYEEGQERDILAPIKMELLSVPINSELDRMDRYRDLVPAGIVHNRARNRAILEKARALNQDGQSVLIFIQLIEHGHELARLAQVLDFPVTFIHGKTEQEDRNLVKSALMDKSNLCVITSQIWREGVNIPNLNAVILAGGGKSKLSVLQTIGRGLRKAPDKDWATIVDILDPYEYLAKHTVHRLMTYVEKGWL